MQKTDNAKSRLLMTFLSLELLCHIKATSLLLISCSTTDVYVVRSSLPLSDPGSMLASAACRQVPPRICSLHQSSHSDLRMRRPHLSQKTYVYRSRLTYLGQPVCAMACSRSAALQQWQSIAEKRTNCSQTCRRNLSGGCNRRAISSGQNRFVLCSATDQEFRCSSRVKTSLTPRT